MVPAQVQVQVQVLRTRSGWVDWADLGLLVPLPHLQIADRRKKGSKCNCRYVDQGTFTMGLGTLTFLRQQLQDMGFTNASQNVRALLATGGNVHSAIEYILNGGGL